MTPKIIAADPFRDTDAGRKIPVFRPKIKADYIVDRYEESDWRDYILDSVPLAAGGTFAAGVVVGAALVSMVLGMTGM